MDAGQTGHFDITLLIWRFATKEDLKATRKEPNVSGLSAWVAENPSQRIPILVALIGLAGTVLGGLLTTVVGPFLVAGIRRLSAAGQRMSTSHAFEARYLDHLISEHRFLPMLPTTLVPVAERQVHELDRLYVSLSLRRGGMASQMVDTATAFRDHKRLVVLGEPGSGKTTMLRLIALTLSRARRGRPLNKLRSAERSLEAQRVTSARERMRIEFGYDDKPLPVFLYLNRLRNLSALIGQKSLVEVLKSEWEATGTLAPVPPNFLQRKLDKGECVLLFDAFDELGTQQARAAAARYIGELAAATVDKGNRFVVTSRIVGYGGQLAEYGFEPVTIQPLSWSAVSALARRWCTSLGEAKLAEQLLNTLRLSPGIAQLAVNPMLLSLIVLVQYVRGLIPDKRHVLYDECVNILVERRYAPPDVQQAYNAIVPGDDAIRVLCDIALHMHTSHVREIPRGALEGRLIPKIVADMGTSPVSRLTPTELLANIEDRSQLLVERGLTEHGEGLMAFSHLTFQEYLASVALKDQASVRSEASVTTDLLNSYATDDHWWEEVALLYAAQLNGVQQKQFFNRMFPLDGQS